ncbi:MAG: tRNA1(Val) (adenine(37)-N6)-methyltransferase [Candidatus Limivicinus sp.]|jgi:tRNA1Val (adenine37-N6)-methyltransferase
MVQFHELWQGGPIFAQAEHFKLGTDCVLLSDFVNISSARRGIDLGCASGAIALLLLCRSTKLRMTGLEIQPEAAELAGLNMEKNGLSDRAEIITGDIREHRRLFHSGYFDLVVSNPPYFPLGSGLLSPDSDRASARAETNCSLTDICTAASFLLRTGGSFSLVHRPERLCEIFSAMCRGGIEPKRLRLVCHSPDKAPCLVLVEGRRGGKAGLKIEAPLYLNDAGGGESEEFRRIYHR